jgi:hypothetical protein
MPTKYINHWAQVFKSKLVHINKVSNKPKMKYFKTPNASYTNRCKTLRKQKSY